MQKWEYTRLQEGFSSTKNKRGVYSINDTAQTKEFDTDTDMLNELGREGWELIHVGGDSSYKNFILKRPLSN